MIVDAPNGVETGLLAESEVRDLAAEGLASLALDGARVLVLVPDGTRTMPMGLMFDVLQTELTGRVAGLDFLVALGTHRAMTDADLSRHFGVDVRGGIAGRSRVFNHSWNDPESFVTLGTIPVREVEEITGGDLSQDVPVRVNRLILDYDHILICGPVFPHEVAGFSGGAKYFFPGIAAPEMIDVTHWLGALRTSYDTIGVADTPVRRMIHRATQFIDQVHSLLALVVSHDGVMGVFCGETFETWSRAASLSAGRHIVKVQKPFERVLAVMPEMYQDLWTGAKGMYKLEPAVADGGEVCIFAPHIREVSFMHGRVIEEIGYHCRDYFRAQWERFKQYPWGVLAHSTHVKGKGSYDPASRVEMARVKVTLATGIPRAICEKVNLGFRDWRSIERAEWEVVERAGEVLYRA
jgi:nickel-dependent lactate racemase